MGVRALGVAKWGKGQPMPGWARPAAFDLNCNLSDAFLWIWELRAKAPANIERTCSSRHSQTHPQGAKGELGTDPKDGCSIPKNCCMQRMLLSRPSGCSSGIKPWELFPSAVSSVTPFFRFLQIPASATSAE